MTHKNRTANHRGPIHQAEEVNFPSTNREVWTRRASIRKVVTMQCLLLLLVVALPFQAYSVPTYPIDSDVQTTRQRTVRPIAITDAPELTLKEVELYAPNGYSSWEWGDGVDAGKLLLDDFEVGEYESGETLLTFFTMTDVHITDKESPAQIPYEGVGTSATFGESNTSAYSPVILSTTQVLDAAIQTINALHSQTPFDFGIALGDTINSNQYNELRWYLDVIDGKQITPSSGAHRGAHGGANAIDYQKSYRAAGLNKSIPWYQVIGNHDQYWAGSLVFNDYVRRNLVRNTVLNMGLDETNFPTFDARDFYVGVIDGKTRYGTVIDYGPAGTMATPIVVADLRRRALSTETSNSLNWMKEFFNTTSKPKGHGFTQTNLDNDFASYSFEPKASLPLKIIALDDTCKVNPYANASSYARACLDQERYDWLVNELEQGQADGKLMIIAAHIPVGPQLNVPDAPVGELPNDTVVPLFLSTCNATPDNIGFPCPYNEPITNNDSVPPYSVVTDAMLLETLHNYPNLLLWISGHRHINTVTPQPAPEGKGPEFGFWEVETSSLRDFPQQFRTFEIVRNDNNTVSIVVTDVDPADQADPDAQPETPAAKSRGYAIGAGRISAGILDDTTSHAYNAELIKVLPTPYTITVDVTGPGAVTSSPYSGVNCTADVSPCSATFLPGTPITLVASPTVPGAAFSGWSGASACSGTSDCSITLIDDANVTATFTQAPTLAVTPTYKTFGNQKIGKTTNATFTVKNTATKGIANLTIGAIAIGEVDAGQFKLVNGRDRCSGQTIKPGKSCSFRVSFVPNSVYTKFATITIPSNDANTPNIIPITGVGK